jgi:two-component system, LytTR family, response regulator
MFRALIVDDEPLARKALESMLALRSDVEAVESATDAVDALQILKARHLDIVLLDISMPEMSGIELMEALVALKRPLPSIIFVTAFQEHALAAFECQAVDYVLKPFSAERINVAIDHAVRRTQAERAIALMGSLPQVQKPAAGARLAIKVQGRILFVEPSQITCVQAEGNYVTLQSESGSSLLRESITNIEQKLKPFGFIRIHRSVLVNSAFVSEIQPWFTGEYVLKLRNGKEFSVTRTYKRNLAALADLWIGSEGFAAE